MVGNPLSCNRSELVHTWKARLLVSWGWRADSCLFGCQGSSLGCMPLGLLYPVDKDATVGILVKIAKWWAPLRLLCTPLTVAPDSGKKNTPDRKRSAGLCWVLRCSSSTLTWQSLTLHSLAKKKCFTRSSFTKQGQERQISSREAAN